MFPLSSNKIVGYGFGAKTFYSNFHLGGDYGNLGDEIKAPFDGQILQTSVLKEMGNCIFFKPDNDDVIMRFGHCREFKVKPGAVTEGQVIGIVGNTGKTRGPHLHLDISKHAVNIYNPKNFVDPEKYDWTKKKLLRASILLNHKPWPSLIKHLANYENWFWEASLGKVKLTAIPVYTNVKSPKKVFTGSSIGGYNVEIIEEKWFDDFIMPLCFPDSDIVIFNMERKDWQGEVFNHPELMEQGYCYAKIGMKYPIKAFTVHNEHDDYPPYYPKLGAFAKTLAHETLHGLYQIIPNSKVIPGGDYVHNHFYGNSITGDLAIPENCFKDFNL